MEQELWQSVILRAVTDAAGLLGGDPPTSKKRLQSQAQTWFGSRDFFTVCELAGLDGKFILDAYRRGAFRAEVMKSIGKYSKEAAA